MLTLATIPTINCQLRSENVHLEATGPGIVPPHLHESYERVTLICLIEVTRLLFPAR